MATHSFVVRMTPRGRIFWPVIVTVGADYVVVVVSDCGSGERRRSIVPGRRAAIAVAGNVTSDTAPVANRDGPINRGRVVGLQHGRAERMSRWWFPDAVGLRRSS